MSSVASHRRNTSKITRHRIDELKLGEDFEVIRIAERTLQYALSTVVRRVRYNGGQGECHGANASG